MFFHLDLESFDSPNGRVYKINNREYTSVTTVTGHFAKAGINAWKSRVGYDVANKIIEESSIRGTQLHSLCEDYFLSNLKEDEKDSFREDTKQMFLSIKPHLERAETPYSIETALYSDWLKVAGRSDYIGTYEGIPSVVDFKTSRKPKRRSWINGYFAQLAMYAFCFKERTGVTLDQLVVLMVSLNGEVQVFKEKVTQWHYDNMFKYLNKYNSDFGGMVP